MNAGSIHKDTAAGRVYRCLLARAGAEWGGGELGEAAKTNCLSTRVSEVRKQLQPWERVITRSGKKADGTKGFFYRIVIEPRDVAA